MSDQFLEITIYKENDNGNFEPLTDLTGLNKSKYWRFVDNKAKHIIYFRPHEEGFYRYFGNLAKNCSSIYIEEYTSIGTYLDGVYNQVSSIVFMYLKEAYVNVASKPLISPIEEQANISARYVEIKFYKNLRRESVNLISWGSRNEFSTVHLGHINGFENPGDYLIANNGKDWYCLYDYQKDQPTRYYPYFLRININKQKED